MVHGFIIELVKFYLVLTFALTVFSILGMYFTEIFAYHKKAGKKRIQELMDQGRFRQYLIYSIEQIREKKKRAVVRISVFPSDREGKSKVVIICPGGGYSHLCTEGEAYPVAARLNELGYTAFVLNYRVKFNCSSHAPMQDLAQAVHFIEKRQDFFHVDITDYAVIGFSAGGNLAGIFGTKEYGYEKYEAMKPGALILGYPWTNVNHWIIHPYWNIWVGLLGIWLSERGNIYMFGFGHHFNKEKRDSLCVQKWITSDYPPTYMFAGSNDVLVPSGAHTDIMAKALEANQVPMMYEKYFGIPHGIGIGYKTPAYGWLEKAITFWQEQITLN